jgi:predicted acetyltransferase
MRIRRATGSDIDSIATLLSKSFLEDPSIIRVNLEGNPRYSLSDMYVVEDITSPSHVEVAGCLRITPFEVYSRCTKLSMGGIAAVAVLPEARRRGIAEALMEDALRKMYETGYPISILFPFKHNFYEKFGYGYVGSIAQYEFSPNNILNFEERSHVRSFIRSDRNVLKKVFQRYVQNHGSFTVLRNDSFWESVVFPKFKDAYVYDDGEIKGYVVCEISKEHEAFNAIDAGIVLDIKEFVAVDAAANRGLWGFLHALGEQVSRIRFLGPASYPMSLFLREPREYSFRRIFFEYRTFYTIAAGFMLRIINVRDALSKLRHTIETPFDIVVKINDGNLPQNARVFNVHVHNGETVVDETNQKIQFETDIKIFSQIYAGFIKPSDALKYGFARCEPQIVEKLDRLFAAPAPFIYQFDIF